MQEFFEITSSAGNYQVTVGHNLLAKISSENVNAIFLVDDIFASNACIPTDRCIRIASSESSKSLECMADVIIGLRKMGVNRNSHLVAIGGGVIQDIATFAASIYMRGLAWTYLPTTLLAMTDSCIGGKSSINVKGFKNLVGNFYPPREVLIDVDFVNTLTPEMVLGGLFEAGKICYARDYETFLSFLAEAPNVQMSPAGLRRIIVMALRTKKWFIEVDEFDQKERLLLNFGHTFGHALEAGTNFGVTHGIAVGIGMLIAIEISHRRSWLNNVGLERTAVLANHVKSMIGSGSKCGVKHPAEIIMKQVIDKFDNDKKHTAEAYRVVCPCNNGDLEVVQLPKGDLARAEITAGFEAALRSLEWHVA